ncbi:MAG: MarR family winged helix-turn-helix transcriptional regulator [Asticcacaulis sp.]|uniref:MarR family winged helix-turn-helix transcriptional regulator n=1 Tax=Asticcacaulis sp. TaxID=1872648 RepID=UPI0039E2BA1C
MPTSSFCIDDSIVQRLSMASLAMRNCRSQLYKDRYNLNIAGWQILVRVYEHGPAVQRQLCTLNKIDKVTVSRAVFQLVKRNLLTRVNSNQDKRSQYLFLTPYGEELCRRLVFDARELEQQVFSDMSHTDNHLLGRLLDQTQMTASRLTTI